MKPYLGLIVRWCKVPLPPGEDGLGYKIVGTPVGHPLIKGRILTSHVLKHDEETGDIETLNSRYTLRFPLPIRMILKRKD